VVRDSKGQRIVLGQDGKPFQGTLPAGVGAAYSSRAAWQEGWDGRERTKPSVRRNIVLVRHGEYHMDKQHEEYGKLTDRGHAQAGHVAMRLRLMHEQGGLPAQTVIHSDMPRAVQTFEAVRAHLAPSIQDACDPDLAEGRPCVPEPSRTARKWPAQQLVADGQRIERAFCRHIHRASEESNEEECIVVVCHANVIRYMVCRALQLPPEAWLRMSLPHCSITTICVHPNGRVSLRGFGDSGHLDPSMTTR